jgi:hypothetical protein
MAKFITYPVDLQCPACKRRGEAEAREFLGDPRYTLACLTNQFVLLKASDRPETAWVLCPCGADFNA